MGLVSTAVMPKQPMVPSTSPLPNGVGDKLREVIPTVAPEDYGFKGVVGSKNPLAAFLNKGIAESPEALKEKYSSLYDSGNFGFRRAPSLGMDPMTTSALRGKMTSKLGDTIGLNKGNLLRQIPFDFAKRQGVYQGLADADVRRVMGIEAQAAQAAEAAKQKRSALTGGLLGLAGTGIGAAAGGPAGAMVGGGIGSMLGGLI